MENRLMPMKVSYHPVGRGSEQILKRIYSVILMFSLAITQGFAQTKTLDQLQREHAELRFGMFIHFNMNTYVTGWGNARVNPLIFNPSKLDCGQWARAAQSAGMKYAVLTCKHHDGFALWPSQQVPPNGLSLYTVAQSSIAGRDVVREYVDSCIKYGILPGLYPSRINKIADITAGAFGIFVLKINALE